MISLKDFVDDEPWQDQPDTLADLSLQCQIADLRVRRLVTHADRRGDLTVLLSTQYGTFEPHPPHVYSVTADPGSVRAWVFHRLQHDRLAFTNGNFRVVLYDLRPEAPTYLQMNVLDVGDTNKVLLTIPPFVVHGVQNVGWDKASFINMPTRAYDPARPDKARVPMDHPGIPYKFL
jgi:dTDP-4-dehydrorhamnose 3,5-epimerase